MSSNQLVFFSSKVTLLIVVSAACIGASIVSPCLPAISKHFNIYNNQTGMLMSIYLFGYLGGQFFYSMLSKILGYRCSLLIGFSIYFIATLAQLTAMNWQLLGLLFVSRFFCAFGASSGLICVFAIINEFFSKKDSHKFISLAFISLTLFSYLSITIGGILTQLFGWETVFYLMSFIAILQLIMIFKFIPELRVANTNTIKDFSAFFVTYFKSILNIELLLASIIVAFTTTTTYLYATIAPAISYNLLLISPSVFGMLTVFNLMGLLIGGYLSSCFFKKYNALNILMFGLLISVIPIVLFSSFHYLIFQANKYEFIFFILTTWLNFGLGFIYPSASFLALNSIKCNATSSSIMNIIKIGSPAITITIIAGSRLSLVNSFKIPLSIFFIMALISFCILKLISLLKIS